MDGWLISNNLTEPNLGYLALPDKLTTPQSIISSSNTPQALEDAMGIIWSKSFFIFW